MEWTKVSLIEARESLRRAAAAQAKIQNHGGVIDNLVEIARVEERLGNRQGSLKILESARKVALKRQLKDKQAIVEAELSLLAYDLGDPQRSKLYAESSIAAAKLSSNPLAEGMAEFAMAELLYFNVELAGAESLYVSSINKLHGLYGQGEIDALIGLGYLYLRNDKNKQGLEKFHQALETAEQNSNVRGKAMALKAVASALNNLNRKQDALEYYLQAKALFPQDGIDLTELGILYNGIGSIFEFYTNWDQALQNKTKAYELFSKDNYVYGQLATLSNIGGLSYLTGNTAMANQYLQKSIALATRTGNKYHLALALEELGNIEFSEGRHAASVKKLWRASIIYESIGNRRQNSLVHAKIGQIQIATGDLAAARESLDKASKLGAEVQNRFATAEVLFQKARLEKMAGRPEAALYLIDEAIKLDQTISTDVRNSKLQRAYRSSTFDRFHFIIELQMNILRAGQYGLSSIEPLLSAERARAHSIHQSLGISGASVFADADPATTQRQYDLQKSISTALDSLTDHLSKRSEGGEIEKVEAEIAQLELQLLQVKAEQKHKSPVYSAINDPEAFDLADFQGNVLRDGEVLLEYFLGNNESYLWLIEKDQFKWFELPPKEQIESQIDALRNLLDARKPKEGESFLDLQARIADADAKYPQFARELSNLILGPVAEKLAGNRLIVVPDGKLHYFPISALPMPNAPSDDPILLTNEVVYQPSAQTYTLLKTLRGGDKKVQNTKDLLVFSDPVFNPSDERLTKLNIVEKKDPEPYSYRLVESFSTLSRLPASGEEAASISEIVGGTADVISGFDATRDRLLNTNLADYRVLHLATHGFVDVDRPELSSIILSRFDQAGNAIDQSVRMQDIYAMKLNADLVVLSACKTGTGKEIKGEGVMGLNTAFLQAGARSVVSTLWQVEDNAANHLMKEFYTRMVSDGMAPSAALRAAQIKLYQDPQFRSPFFWAAFTIQGDAGTPPQFTRSYARPFAAAGVLAALLIIGFLFWKRRSAQRTSKL